MLKVDNGDIAGPRTILISPQSVNSKMLNDTYVIIEDCCLALGVNLISS